MRALTLAYERTLEARLRISGSNAGGSTTEFGLCAVLGTKMDETYLTQHIESSMRPAVVALPKPAERLK